MARTKSEVHFEGARPGPVELEVALLGADLESNVKGGENSGRKLRHDFVVLDLAKIDMTKESNHWIATLSLPKTSDKPRAIRRLGDFGRRNSADSNNRRLAQVLAGIGDAGHRKR